MIDHAKFISNVLDLSEKLLPSVKSKEKRISQITGENESTVKNWLFHARTPPLKKRTAISDKLGVSEAFLFGESDVFSIPLAIYHADIDSWLIPLIRESDLHILKENYQLCVLDRIPLKIRENVGRELVHPEQTYCVEIHNVGFPPFIEKNDYVFINQTAPIKEGNFCFYYTKNSIEIIRLKHMDDGIELINKMGKRKRIEHNSTIIPIVLTLSAGH